MCRAGALVFDCPGDLDLLPACYCTRNNAGSGHNKIRRRVVDSYGADKPVVVFMRLRLVAITVSDENEIRAALVRNLDS